MADHSSRGHAEWSASATARNWTCAGAIALNSRNPKPEIESEASAWGTACHEISEYCLRDNLDADHFIGMRAETKQRKIEVDEELAETAQVYVDYVRAGIDKSAGGMFKLEQNFSLASLQPPFEAGGTADAVIHFPAVKLLEVIDLKGGRGVVEAADNKQLRTYALGAVMANPGIDVERVTVTIVQPRAPHKNGRIRSETFHIADLVEWTADLLAAMNRSKEASDVFDTMPFAAWWSKYLTPGNCKFCSSEGSCPALEQRALDAAGVWFNDLDQPQISNAPDTGTPEKLASDLDVLDMIADWINARRAYAHQQADSGVEIPGYILVPKQGREKWKEGTEDIVRTAAAKAKLADDKYLNPAKLKTPKQIRKALGVKYEKLVEGLSITPSEGANLVRADKTTRAAVAPAVNKHFQPIED